MMDIVYIDNIIINMISIKDLIINKRAAGRDQDIADANKEKVFYFFSLSAL